MFLAEPPPRDTVVVDVCHCTGPAVAVDLRWGPRRSEGTTAAPDVSTGGNWEGTGRVGGNWEGTGRVQLNFSTNLKWLQKRKPVN